MNFKLQITLIVLFGLSCNASCQTSSEGKMFENLNHPPQLNFFSAKSPKIENWKRIYDAEISQEIFREYELSPEIIDNLYIYSAFRSQDISLVYYGVDWKNTGKNSRESRSHKHIIEKNCAHIKSNFPGSCAFHDPLRVVAYGLFDFSKGRIVPLPDSWDMGTGADSILSGDAYEKSRTSLVENIRFDMKLYGGAFRDARYGLSNGESRECLAGKFVLSDFNGDGKDELFVFSGEMDDDLYVAQVEKKEIGLTRARVAILDFSSGDAVPILAQELFSYEMKYEKDGGNGIYRDSKLYWGDYNSDKKYDYIVRERQADLTYQPDGASDSFVSQPFEEKISLYLGSGNNKYVLFNAEDKEKVEDYLLDETSWENGFPSFTKCRL